MSEYTKKGHMLRHAQGLVFQCLCRGVVFKDAEKPEDRFLTWEAEGLSILQLIAPATQAQIVSTIKAWLTAYDDEELLTQVDALVPEVLAKMPKLPTGGTPSTAPGRGQVN